MGNASKILAQHLTPSRDSVDYNGMVMYACNCVLGRLEEEDYVQG